MKCFSDFLLASSFEAWRSMRLMKIHDGIFIPVRSDERTKTEALVEPFVSPTESAGFRDCKGSALANCPE